MLWTVLAVSVMACSNDNNETQDTSESIIGIRRSVSIEYSGTTETTQHCVIT